MPKRVRIRQSPGASLASGIVSLVFVGIGLAVVIPQIGGFGYVWTGFALIGAVASFYNAFSEHGIADRVIDLPDDAPTALGVPTGQTPTPPADIEARLRTLADLQRKGLITPEEFAKRRAAVIDGI